MQPPLLRLLTMSAFEGIPLSADVLNGSPLKVAILLLLLAALLEWPWPTDLGSTFNARLIRTIIPDCRIHVTRSPAPRE